ncbi:MAG: hypothetical protein JRJ54_12650 [Deltaproteobacteria bacterium]|nr:hypothetical protein [Deltaproteobacteria bacterium]
MSTDFEAWQKTSIEIWLGTLVRLWKIIRASSSQEMRPDVPVQIATWTRVKVHGNCHVQFEKAYYSAPFRLVHQELFLKATDTSVKRYYDL